VTAFWGDAVWTALAVATLVLWALSHARSNGRRVVVPASATLTRLATDPWLRVPLVLGWAWVGWHLFAR
jgi:hypothetical protein